jgi:hypothetical protein
VRQREAIIRPSIPKYLPAECGYAGGVQMHHRRRALLFGAGMTLSAMVCAGLLAAAVLVPAPHAALPFLILTCIACPMAAAFEPANAIHVLREPRMQLRRELDRLPETPHPLGY